MEGGTGEPASESVRAELERLREENARLRASLREREELLAIAPAFFGFLSLEGRVLTLNELALQVIEATSEQVIGVPFWEAAWWKAIPASAARVRQAVDDAVAGTASRFDIEYWATVGGQGRPRWVELHIQPVPADGPVERLSATGVDITQRREAQRALSESQEQLARAVAVSRVGFFDWDVSSERITFSDQMRRDWGAPPMLSLEQTVARIHPEDRPRVIALVERILREREGFSTEYRVLRPDGELVWIEAQGELHLGADGNPRRFFGTSMNITGRKRNEAVLRAEKHKFEAIFVESEAAIALLRGPQFVFEKINRKYKELMGGRDLEEKPLHEALPELVGQPFHALMEQVFRTGEPFVAREMVARLVRTAGGVPEDTIFDFTYSRVADGEGNPYGIYIHAIDITEKVLARRKLEETKERLEQVVRSLEHEREVRDKFVFTLTHDMRTPLTAARMGAQIIGRRSDDQGVVQKHAGRIVGAIDRADQMIRDLLDASRIKAGERLSLEIRAFDLVKLTSETLDELGTIHGDRFVLRAPPSLEGHWAQDDLRRILENLCSNAVKYGAALAPVTVTVEPQGLEVSVRVHNEGPAIGESELKSIFEPFRRSTTAQLAGQKGWGLGLTLVRGITEAHGGRVRVSSSAEEGTTFEVILPIDSRPA